MALYLLDTNIVLRLAHADDVQHELVSEAVSKILAQEQECCLISQILIEFWVVSTRPVDVNGLGWAATQAEDVITQLLHRFPLLEDRPEIFAIWQQLVSTQKIVGKRAHDARIAAAMLTHGVTHLLTFNTQDFTQVSDITVVAPQSIIAE
ncbi:MAG: PIN domain-containing protein [Leptolyngbya sp. SIOISBB]|nr:PIN domain-containing protein [Leptolyngbya sp. SIOISBB]